MSESLERYAKVVVETDKQNPTPIATITGGAVEVAEGYRVRLMPYVFVPEDSNGKRLGNEKSCNKPN